MNKLAKRVIIGLISTTILGAMVGCGNSSEVAKDSEKASEEKVFRIGVPGTDGALSGELLNFVDKSGYLEEELENIGYKLEIVPFPGAGPAVNEALAGGSIDGAAYGDLPAVVSNSNGINTTIVGITNQQIQYGLLSVNPNIKTAKDIEGKKVIVPEGTAMSYFWGEYAAANKLDVSKIETINTADPSSLLATGEADIYVSTLTTVNMMAGMGLGSVLDSGVNYELADSQAVLVIRDEYLSKNEDTAVAANKALIRAYNAAVENPESFYESLASENLPKELAKTGYEWNETLSQLNPEITSKSVDNLKNLVNWAKENNLIFNEIDLDERIDTSYYEKAKESIE